MLKAGHVMLKPKEPNNKALAPLRKIVIQLSPFLDKVRG